MAFVRLVMMFGGTGKTVVFAVGVYVFYPGLNEVQSMIIRDFAYLACFLWMVVNFLEQTWNPTRSRLIAFIVTALLATLFRIEGLIFIFGLIVFYLMSGTVSKRFRLYGILAIATVLPALVYGVLMWIYDGELGNAWGVVVTMFQFLEEELLESISSVDSAWLKSALTGAVPFILPVMPFVKQAFNILEILSAGYVLILAWGLFHRPLIRDRGSRTMLLKKGWTWIVGINLLVLIGFVMIRQIITDRYPLSLALMLMVFLPFAIRAILDHPRVQPILRTTIPCVLGILLVVNSVEGLDRFSNKYHLREAGLWVKSHYDEPYSRTKVYSNNRLVDYYAGKKEVEEDLYYGINTVIGLTQSNRWKKLHFMAIALRADSPPGFYRNFRYLFGKEPDRIFENEKGSKVLVYDLRMEKNPIKRSATNSQ